VARWQVSDNKSIRLKEWSQHNINLDKINSRRSNNSMISSILTKEQMKVLTTSLVINSTTTITRIIRKKINITKKVVEEVVTTKKSSINIGIKKIEKIDSITNRIAISSTTNISIKIISMKSNNTIIRINSKIMKVKRNINRITTTSRKITVIIKATSSSKGLLITYLNLFQLW
jgi:hypothetical protein